MSCGAPSAHPDPACPDQSFRPRKELAEGPQGPAQPTCPDRPLPSWEGACRRARPDLSATVPGPTASTTGHPVRPGRTGGTKDKEWREAAPGPPLALRPPHAALLPRLGDRLHGRPRSRTWPRPSGFFGERYAVDWVRSTARPAIDAIHPLAAGAPTLAPPRSRIITWELVEMASTRNALGALPSGTSLRMGAQIDAQMDPMPPSSSLRSGLDTPLTPSRSRPAPVRPDLSFPSRKEPAAGPSATAGSRRIEGRTVNGAPPPFVLTCPSLCGRSLPQVLLRPQGAEGSKGRWAKDQRGAYRGPRQERARSRGRAPPGPLS